MKEKKESKTKTVTITVTQYCINKARKELKGMVATSLFCPIAQALKRDKISFMAVLGDYIELPNHRRSMLPPDAIEFIEKFDEKEPVMPFSFEIEIPLKIEKV